MQTFLSFVIFIQLFFVVVSLASNFAPAAWQLELLSRFRWYTRLLNFDLNYTPYYLTHGTEFDVDHRIEVLPVGKDGAQDGNWLVLPSEGFRGGEAYKRYQRFASIWAFHAQTNGEPARFAQSVGTYFSRQLAIRPQQIRCRRHFLQSPEDLLQGTPARRDPNDPSFFAVVYAANAIVGETGMVEVIRVEDASQVAQPTRSDGTARGGARK